MKKNYIKPQCETIKMDTLAPLAGSGIIERIICTWQPWKRNIHWDDDGVGGWSLNGSGENTDFPFVRSDDAVKNGYTGKWYYTLEIIDH